MNSVAILGTFGFCFGDNETKGNRNNRDNFAHDVLSLI